MKQPMMLVALVGFSTAFCLADDLSRWSLSGGVQARQISADFSAPSPGGWAGWQAAYGSGDANGAMVLYDGVTPRMQYSDGAVIFDTTFTPFDGSALFGVDDAAQLGVNPVNGYDTATFSAHANRLSSNVSGRDLSADDDCLTVQPLVSVSLALVQRANGVLAALVRYGVTQGSLDSGREVTGVQTIERKTTLGRFEYDVDPQSGPLPTPPFEGSETPPGYWIVFDADTYNTTYPFFSTTDPRATYSSSRRTTDRIIAYSEAGLDVTLHEILLGLQYTVKPASRLELSISAGPTLNIVSWDMDGCTSWESENTGAVLTSVTDSDSGTDLAIGAAAGLAVRFDLDAAGRFYLEANAGYSWVDSVQAEAGPFKANIDASSLTGGAAVGVRL